MTRPAEAAAASQCPTLSIARPKEVIVSMHFMGTTISKLEKCEEENVCLITLFQGVMLQRKGEMNPSWKEIYGQEKV